MPKASPPYQAKSATDEAVNFPAGNNPFLTQGFSLLSVVPKLRNLPYHHAVDELLHQLAGEIRRFEKQLTGRSIREEQVNIASYLLCTLIDETVLNTPWGGQSRWGYQSLLIQFHREAKGGERFFQLLERLRLHPDQNLNLLELAYVCLSFGFEGKYRHEASGMRDLDRLREDLYLLIQRTRGGGEAPLSIRWQGLQDRRTPIEKQLPVWVGMVVAGALLTIIYMGFAYAINGASNLTYQHMANAAREEKRLAPVGRRHAATPTAPAYRPLGTDRFERVLAEEIARGMVEIVDGHILRVSHSFPSGSDRIGNAYVPMLEKIARELQSDSHLITVIGHTDNRPIFSARFPSNWHLSQARAKNVATLMTTAAPLEGRVRFEGRADSEPIGPNDTAANRARNRRIDIHIR